MTSSLAAFAHFLLLSCALLSFGGCKTGGDEVYDETRGWSADRLYNEAKAELVGGDYKKAIKYYSVLESRFPYGKYAQQAQLEMGYAFYKDSDPAQALAAADRFIKLYPDHANVDYAYYLKGLVNFNEDLGLFGGLSNQDMSERDPKAARESFEAFRELVTRYPKSRYAQDAYARMRYLLNAMATNEARTAAYYYRRKAYIAAVNRAQEVLRSYPKTPAVEQALVVMVKSYDAMDLPELRDDADRLLKRNFPNTQYALANKQKGKWWEIWN